MLILASSSPARQTILTKLGLDFEVVKPEIDESSLPDESATDLVARLSIQKAQKVGQTHTGLIIGSDQVACVGEQILTKPHTHQNAIEQLSSCSGRCVLFLTSLTLLNTKTQKTQTIVEQTEVFFRCLSLAQIEGYLLKEQPYQCAGSFKSEGLGGALFEKITGRDANTLMGLPLMALVDMLLLEGVDVLKR